MTGNRSDRTSTSQTDKIAEPRSEETAQLDLPGFGAIDFEELAQGNHRILIRLAGETYTMRKTHSGKLILNQ